MQASGSSKAHGAPKAPFANQTAAMVLVGLSLVLGLNHIGARIAFDHGTGVINAIFFRSLGTALGAALTLALVRGSFQARTGTRGWLLLTGFLVFVQSIFLYSAVASIPVGLALLGFSTFAAQLMLISWLYGGPSPGKRRLAVLGLILMGLALVLNVPRVVSGGASLSGDLFQGLVYAVIAGFGMAHVLWLNQHRLGAVSGLLRTTWLLSVTSLCMLLVLLFTEVFHVQGALPSSWFGLPHDTTGWFGIALLTACYGVGMTLLLVLTPRLTMAKNGPAMNAEPVFTLALGWLLLGQTITPIQIAGAAVTLGSIVWLATLKK